MYFSGSTHTKSLVKRNFLNWTPFGRESHGAKRWIYIGPISFQPAELVKISVIIMAAAKMCASGTKKKNCHR